MKPTIAVYLGAGNQCRWMLAFADGLERHGLRASLSANHADMGADISVFWGMYRRDLIEAVRHEKRHFIAFSHAILGDRKRYASIGWDGIEGDADYCNAMCDATRWQRLGLSLKSWRDSGSHIVLGGQEGLDPYWYTDTINRIRRYTEQPIYFRPHTNGHVYINPVTHTFDGAACLVVHSAPVAVDAIIHGIPVVALAPSSLVHTVSGKALRDVTTPPRPDRSQWAWNLAYAQWSVSEVRSGVAWDHLKSKLDTL